MESLYFTYLNGVEIADLALTDLEIIDAVEAGLRAQGDGDTAIEPRVHLEPGERFNGHFNVLRGYVGPMNLAGVKVVGDFVDNYRKGLPSELAMLTLLDPSTGAPVALLDATAITEMRTGAMSAVGARHLARPESKVLAHVGARGTAYWNVRLIAELFDLDEVRVHSRRPESRTEFAERLRRDLDVRIVVTDDWESCVRDADIVVEASRLQAPEPLLRTEWIKKGALVVPYGTMSAVELSLTSIADKVVVDDWGQCRTGKFGSLRAHVDAGLLTAETLHAELCDVVVGSRPGRERDDDTVLFWHRGLSLSDIALGSAILEKARQRGAGTRLLFR